MAELYLVLFFNRQRTHLPDSLGRRASPDLGLLDFALAEFQLRLAPDKSSLQIAPPPLEGG